jgi:hypothetical protein
VNVGRVKELTARAERVPRIEGLERRTEKKSGIYAYENRQPPLRGG